MSPDIIKWHERRWIDGHVGVYCICGRTLYVKNVPSAAGQEVVISCPCGCTIHTTYTRYSHN